MSARNVGLRRLALVLFLFSGFSGLIYEVAWSRMFSITLGTTVYAVSTVLGVFMAGLALGSWWFGKLVDAPGVNGLRIYGLLELVIAGYAFVLPQLLDLSNTVFQWLWPLVEGGFFGQMALRVVLAVVVLILPATLMGATLPVLSRCLVDRWRNVGRDIGLLYAVNTLGAVLGVFTAGFFLIEWFGVRATLYGGGAVSAMVGGIALFYSRRLPLAAVVEEESVVEDEGPAARVEPGQLRLILWIYGVSGFAALALEVLWTRSLLYWVSVDTWAFSSMLSAFLFGLGLGSLIMAPLARRVRQPMRLLGMLQVGVGLAAVLTVPMFGGLQSVWSSIEGEVSGQSPLLRHIFTNLSTSFFIMLVPTLLMGMSFPLVSRIYVSGRRLVGQGTGTLYALNTVGAIFGSLAAGFLLIPAFGLQLSIVLCGGLYLIAGSVLLANARGLRLVRVVVGAAAGLVLVVVMLWVVEPRPVIEQSRVFLAGEDQPTLVYNHEGAAGNLAVIRNRRGTLILNVNGINTAINNFMDMLVHRMLSHLPLLLHPAPKKALIVGFGMGSTVWGTCQHELERVDVVELMRAEKAAAGYFEDINHGVLHHPRLNFIEGDGRNYILGTRERYDMISFNAIHPRFSANLYTRDFYQLCKDRMTEDGVLCAWMTQNAMTREEWRGLCGSLIEVFPHCSLWFCNPQHFCLIGAKSKLDIDFSDWQRRMNVPGVKADLADSSLTTPEALMARFMCGTEALRRYVAGAPVTTDDRPRIEFSRESKDDELPIIAELIEMQEDLAPMVRFADAGQSERLKRHQTAAKWLWQGMQEVWYPSGYLKGSTHLLRAGLLTPHCEDLRHSLGVSRYDQGIVEKRLAADPRDAAALTKLGQILGYQGDLVGAERRLRQALVLDPKLTAAALELSVVLNLAGKHQACADVASPWVSRVSEARYLFAFGHSLGRLGRQAESVQILEQARQRSPLVDEWMELRRGFLAAVRR